MYTCPRCGDQRERERKAFYGQVELHNGLVLRWLQWAESEEEAIRIVTAQCVHVTRCWC